MSEQQPFRLGVMWSGDREARRTATAQNNRLAGMFAALAALGIPTEPAVYADEFADEVREQLLAARRRAGLGRSDHRRQEPQRRSMRCCAMSPRAVSGSARIPT